MTSESENKTPKFSGHFSNNKVYVHVYIQVDAVVLCHDKLWWFLESTSCKYMYQWVFVVTAN